MNNACLRQGDDYAYREGYRRGAQILVRAVGATAQDQDFLVYPIVFLYRHYVELVLKEIIRRAPYLIERELTAAEKKHLDDHRLDVLWQDFKPMSSAISEASGWAKLPKKGVEGIDDYIRQISEIDPSSYSLRYAYSKKGDPSLPKRLTHINLRHFGDLMERLSNYLWGIDVGMSAIEDMKHDYESEMASYADDYYDDYY
jgi:phytoene dehydrogenase-like protein